MIIDIKKFKKNILFFIVSIGLLVFIVLISSIFGTGGAKLKEEELGDEIVDINGLIINEVMSSNNGVIADEKGNLYDYVELYNGSEKDISLKNYGLSDEGEGVKWTFPDVTIKSKGYVVVKLNGEKDGGMNANFKLKSSGGEVVALFKPNGKVVDVEMVPSKVIATINVDSPHKEIPVKVIPKGEVQFGKAISSISSSESKVTIYGSQEIIDKIDYLPIEVDVKELSTNKEYNYSFNV